jgi:outer membrane protein OmpA-like peptidoglycan-associated protein
MTIITRARCAAALLGAGCLALTAAAAPAAAQDKMKLLTEVHFDMGSANVTYGGKKKIASAIKAIKDQKPRELRIFGFTDTTGDEDLNKAIARSRADNVASLLMEQGITVPMVVEGKGEHGAPYNIPDGMSEPLNRCVGIIAVGFQEEEEDQADATATN